MELREFNEKVIEVEVEWFGEVVEMGLRPGVWTNDLIARMLTPYSSEEGDANAQAIAQTIAWWNITVEGEPWPVTPENVNKLPTGLITAIPDALAKKVRDEGKTSPAS